MLLTFRGPNALNDNKLTDGSVRARRSVSGSAGAPDSRPQPGSAPGIYGVGKQPGGGIGGTNKDLLAMKSWEGSEMKSP